MTTLLSRSKFFLVFLLVLSGSISSASQASQEDPWLTITPYVGLRHIGLGTTDNASGYKGNIGNKIQSSIFVAIGLETLNYSFDESPWGFTLYGYAANVDLTEQWRANGATNSNGTASGERVNVGTRISGYYSYLVPALHYNKVDTKGNGFKVALGYGEWNANLSGDIILTPNDNPVAGMTKTKVTLNESKLAYLFLMQYQFQSGWAWYMSVGGPSWESNGFTYKLEEVAIALGHRISF